MIPTRISKLQKGGSTTRVPLDSMQYASVPMHTAVHFSGPDTNLVSLITIENLTITDDNKTLTLQARPFDYYDGTVLAAYTQDTVPLYRLDEKTCNKTGIYVEMVKTAPENSDNSRTECNLCVGNCEKRVDDYFFCTNVERELVCY